MWITHSYLGTMRGNMRCLFFLLFEDYIEAQEGFSREVAAEIERFARNMGDKGAVVRPFAGDAERAREDVTAKNWTEEQRQLIRHTPSVLMIDHDFDEFDPSQHQWAVFRLDSENLNPGQLRSLLAKITEAVDANDANPFELVRNAINKAALERFTRAFELKPGIFGLSIDLREAWSSLKEALRAERANVK